MARCGKRRGIYSYIYVILYIVKYPERLGEHSQSKEGCWLSSSGLQLHIPSPFSFGDDFSFETGVHVSQIACQITGLMLLLSWWKGSSILHSSVFMAAQQPGFESRGFQDLECHASPTLPNCESALFLYGKHWTSGLSTPPYGNGVNIFPPSPQTPCVRAKEGHFEHLN